MPPRAALREPHGAPDRGLLVLEQKLRLLARGPDPTRRNPALDVLTGRVPDERLHTLQAGLLTVRPVAPAETPQTTRRAEPNTPQPPAPTGPTAMVLPVAAVRMAAVARARRVAPSPWLPASDGVRPRLKLVTPPPSRWSRVPWLGVVLAWLKVEYRPYRWTARNPRGHPAS